MKFYLLKKIYLCAAILDSVFIVMLRKSPISKKQQAISNACIAQLTYVALGVWRYLLTVGAAFLFCILLLFRNTFARKLLLHNTQFVFITIKNLFLSPLCPPHTAHRTPHTYNIWYLCKNNFNKISLCH